MPEFQNISPFYPPAFCELFVLKIVHFSPERSTAIGLGGRGKGKRKRPPRPETKWRLAALDNVSFLAAARQLSAFEGKGSGGGGSCDVGEILGGVGAKKSPARWPGFRLTSVSLLHMLEYNFLDLKERHIYPLALPKTRRLHPP